MKMWKWQSRELEFYHFKDHGKDDFLIIFTAESHPMIK